MSSADLYNPTEEHAVLRSMVRDFTEREVQPQALEFDRLEKFNMPLFHKLGELGLLGITVDEQFGGSGMDPVATVLVHEELSAVDPGFCLAYLAHSMLFVNNLQHNGNDEQRQRFLPKAAWRAHRWHVYEQPSAGTDVLGMSTTAKRDGDDHILNSRKMWITNGCIDDETLGDVFGLCGLVPPEPT